MSRTEMVKSFLGGRISVVVGDIVRQQVDAIVNAANWTLLGGGGVDAAIHEAGGPQILAECREIRRTTHPNGLPTGEAVITSGGLLQARHVIHTVGPIRGANVECEGEQLDSSRASIAKSSRIDPNHEAELLAACYRNSLALAIAHGLRTIAFPAISTGAYGYPRDGAARVSSIVVREVLDESDALSEVRLVFFSSSDAEIFLKHQQFIPAVQKPAEE